LVGDYVERGENHERRYYQKMQFIPGHEDIKVFLYYWDDRDGAEFCGWWFGNELGGSQVWARSNSHGDLPPRTGWKIPWDAPRVEPGLLLCEPVGSGAANAGAAAAPVPWSPAKPSFPPEPPAAPSGRTPWSSAGANRPTPAASPAAQAAQRKGEEEAKRQKAREQAKAAEDSKKASEAAAAAKRDAMAKAKQKEREEKDAKDLADSLPAAKEMTSAAEDSVEVVATMASPLLAEPPEEMNEVMAKALEDVETAAKEAQHKVSEARREINAKLQGARTYSAETRKNAISEFSALQQKLTDAQKKLNPLKSFKAELNQKIQVRSALKEIAAKLESAEVEVEKATMMTGSVDRQMTEDEVASTLEVLRPAREVIAAAAQMIERKLYELDEIDAPRKEELIKIKDRASKSADGLLASLKKQREGLAASDSVLGFLKKVDVAEECLATCQEAEMPFLKGIEILPPDESVKAIGDCESGAAKAEMAVSTARAMLRSRFSELKRYSKEVASRTQDELKAQEKRLEGVAKKLADFKKETAERKTAAMLAEAHEAVSEAEKKAAALGKACEGLTLENLDGVAAEALKESVEGTGTCEREAAAAISKARQVLLAKQKESKSPDLTSSLKKLQDRMTAAQGEMSKHRKVSSIGEKLLKGKAVLVEQVEKLQQIEEDIERADKVAKPEGSEKASDEDIEAMGTSMTAAQKALKLATVSIDPYLTAAPAALKASLQGLLVKCKASQEKVGKLLAATRERREQVLGEAMVKEGKAKTADVEVIMAKVDEAELPFLKGVEVLPLKETASMIADSEAAAEEAQGLISSTRTYIAEKNLEIKHFAEGAAKPIAGELSKLTEQVNSAASKLSAFKKDTEARKLNSQMQAVGEKVSAVEDEVKKTAEALEPLTKDDVADLSAEDAGAKCETLIGQLKAATGAAEDARTTIAARRRDSKGNTAFTETLDKLSARLKEATVDLAKHRKSGNVHEQRYVSRMLIKQSTEQVVECEAAAAKCAEVCAPLVKEGGKKFLVANSVDTLAGALRDHMKAKDLTTEALFAEIAGPAGGGVNEETFTAYLEKLPEAIGHEEVAFTPERRSEAFRHMDTAAIGSVTLDAFRDIFNLRFVCVKGISVTDSFEIKSGKAVAKVEVGDTLEAIGGPKTDPSNGMMRLECKVVSSGKVGFVTLEGNQGTKYAEQVSAFRIFCEEMDKTVSEAMKLSGKVQNLIGTKLKELEKPGKEGPLADARAELAKLKPRIGKALGSLESLKKQGAVERRNFQKAEETERNAYIQAREKKEAAAFTKPASDKVQAMEEAAKAVEEAAKPFLALAEAEQAKFATPVALSEAVTAAMQQCGASVKAAQDCIAEQQALLPKGELKSALLDAKKELARLNAKADEAKRKTAVTASAVRKACAKVVSAARVLAAAALRGEMTNKSLSLEKLFMEIVTPGDERISEAAFCKYLSGLPGQEFQPEHLALLCRDLETGGLGRRKLFEFLQQYFEVAKPIAITSEFEISKGKSLRKAELGETLEVLEGPKTDEKLGMARVKARSLNDNLEGWITLKGNQGTPFLKEKPKPYYTTCKKEVVLSRDIRGAEEVRKLRLDEVLELLEGPKKETFEPAMRVRAKAALDEKMGWLTTTDKFGVVCAEADGKQYTCTAAIAMTDNLDIKACKVLRKLAVGELFVAVEGPIEEAEAGVTRVKGRALKDEVVGWITMKGNAGTVYAEVSSKHYSIIKQVPLQRSKASTSETFRMLAQGEAVEVMEGPMQLTFAPEIRVRCRALTDGVEGWVTVDDTVRLWSPHYTCKKAVPMQDSLGLEGATLVRQVEVGERLDMVEGPTEEGGELRIKATARKDNSVGWVTVRDKDGNRLLTS